jgi:hypothetical protein
LDRIDLGWESGKGGTGKIIREWSAPATAWEKEFALLEPSAKQLQRAFPVLKNALLGKPFFGNLFSVASKALNAQTLFPMRWLALTTPG